MFVSTAGFCEKSNFTKSDINLVCLPNHTSYGECSTNILKELCKLNYKVNLFPISQYGIEAAPEDHELLRKCVENSQTFDYKAPSVRIWHANDMALRAGKGPSFAFTIFELDTFTENEITHLNSHDGVIVNSRWAKQVCLNNNINVPIYIVPLAVNSDIFSPNYDHSYGRRKNPSSTSFVNVGKKELRKHDILLKCFEKAFSVEDDVELHMVWSNRILDNTRKSESDGWDKYYRNSPMASKITLYDWLPDQRNVAGIIANSDCGVFPSHAEGWNFGLMQCMSAGLPVITTNYSAHTEYCTNENSLLINVDEVEPAYDGIWFHGAGSWAKFGAAQEEQLINYMRNIHRRKQEGDNLFNVEGVATARRFTWENSAAKLLEAISC